MKKYILIDHFEGIETHNVSEETLRDLYNTLMDDLLWNWRDCGDAETLKHLIEEKYNVYKVDIKQVINAIIDIDKHYEILEDIDNTYRNMNKQLVEQLFMEQQFNDVLDILLDNNIISKQQYDYYMGLYYNEKEYKEDFIENVIDKMEEK